MCFNTKRASQRKAQKQKASPPKQVSAIDPRYSQLQSPIFNKLSAELRLSIYESLLSDLTRFIHLFPLDDLTGYVGHQRCINTQPQLPTWHHDCFGFWKSLGCSTESTSSQRVPEHLLALPLTCKRMHYETIPIVYGGNTFLSQGGRGLAFLQRRVPDTHWAMIRHIHISVLFHSPVKFWLSSIVCGLESWDIWAQGCRAIRSLCSLRSLRINVFVERGWSRGPISTLGVSDESFIAILRPLRDVEAEIFEVELNVDVPESVLEGLGPVNFTVLVRLRHSFAEE